MFTGLIEDLGIVSSVKDADYSKLISIKVNINTDVVKIGDSIAINGACQTVVKKEGQILTFVAMNETIKRTNFKDLKMGDIVNIERAMLANSRLDGHIVTGHIDSTAVLKEIKDDGVAKIFKFTADTELIVEKGSISINGISLTISNVGNDFFEVSILPHTLKNTNLKNLKQNSLVNIEYDILAKYIKKFTNKKADSKLTEEFLKENGF